MGSGELVDWLWPRRPPRSAHTTLHGYICAVRRALEPQRPPRQPSTRLFTHPTGYQLRVDADELDTLCFERLVASAKPALDAYRARYGLGLGRYAESILMSSNVPSRSGPDSVAPRRNVIAWPVQ